MKRFFRYISMLLILILSVSSLAQTTTQWRAMHKVKKHETLFNIANQYGLTVEELLNANSEMNVPGYELKKGSYICIPYTKDQREVIVKKGGEFNSTIPKNNADDIKGRVIRVGVMLPLHNADGDGRRMIEYYRGLLMACDSLKKSGLSVDIHSWNVAADTDIRIILLNKAASQCDVIFGPLYSNQVKPLSDFAMSHGIKLIIPFSISSSEVLRNRDIFQIYQSANDLNETAIKKYFDRFSAYHPVFIDCNDTTSTKGIFTMGLRRQLEAHGISYGITNLKSSEIQFAKAFSRTKPNVVILNTSRSPELNVAFAKLNGMLVNTPGIVISMYGYTEWLMYTQYNLDNFYRFDTYIPSTFYYNSLSSSTRSFEQKYIKQFHSDMQSYLPRFAIAGFDHAYYFLNAFHLYGKSFDGNLKSSYYIPIQTPLHFSRVGNGGLQNKSFMFVHYKYNHTIETIKY